MKKFFEGLKDFLYDSVDYIIVLSIIGIVVVVIGWRIDLLFANDALGVIDKDGQVVDNNIDNEPIHGNVEKEDTVDGNETEETPNNDNEIVQDPTIVKISVPAGSLPSKIGTLLEDKGLIPSKNEFVQKSQELKLDTKLKSGNFNISTDSTIEDIIYLIAK